MLADDIGYLLLLRVVLHRADARKRLHVALAVGHAEVHAHRLAARPQEGVGRELQPDRGGHRRLALGAPRLRPRVRR